MLKDTVRDQLPDSDTLVEAAKQLEQSRTFVEGGQCNRFGGPPSGVLIVHRRIQWHPGQVWEGHVVRTTDGRELELQPYLRLLMDAIGVKTIGTPQTTIIQLALYA